MVSEIGSPGWSLSTVKVLQLTGLSLEEELLEPWEDQKGFAHGG